jgi:teichuronic acid biosynthesis glycosyltransferase TuaC
VRIVVVTTSYPRTAEDPSGHFVRSSALALAAAGHEVHVVAPGGSPFEPPRRRRGGVVVHRAGGGALFAWPGALARAKEAPWRALSAGPFAVGVRARLARIGRVDRAVGHWMVPSAFPLLLGVRAELEVVAHGADVRLLLGAPRFARDRVVASLLDRGAHFTFAAGSLLSALSAALSPSVAAALGLAARVEPPPIDVPDGARAAGAALRGGLGLAPGEPLLVAVARLIPSKRVDLAIDAVSALGRPARLVVVGDGPERRALEARAASLGLSAPDPRGAPVRFTGALPRREALAWVAAADALVHASEVEAAPTVIREARALGTPVVACDAGDVRAWAHDDAGIRVVRPSCEAIAEAARAIAAA